MARTRLDRETLEAALVGLQLQLDQIEAKMAELHHQVSGRDGTGRIGAALVRKRRRMSTAARKRIAAAQKKRWAAYRKKKAA